MVEKYIKLQDAKDVFYYSLADGDCAIADYHEAYELLDSLDTFEFERREKPEEADDMTAAKGKRR